MVRSATASSLGGRQVSHAERRTHFEFPMLSGRLVCGLRILKGNRHRYAWRLQATTCEKCRACVRARSLPSLVVGR